VIAPWARFTEVNGWPPVSTDPFLVQGHTETPPYAVVRVSPASTDTYVSLVSDTVVAAGTVVVMRHQSRDGKVLGRSFVMTKAEDGWSYLALSPEGVPVTIDQQLCAGCHATAVGDSLFGPPRAKAAARE